MEERVPYYDRSRRHISHIKDMLVGITDYSDGYWSEEPITTNPWSSTYTKPSAKPSTPVPVPEIPNTMKRDKRLTDDDWETLQKVNPEIVSRMILSGRFDIRGDLPLDWMNEHFESVYYWPGDVLYVESENDAVALKLKFEG